MTFRKFQASHLFTGTAMLPGNNVLIANPDGTIEAIVPREEAGDGIEQLTGILSPGFINCHCHLELSHMKGLIPVHTGLVDFVFKVVTQRYFPDEEIRQAVSNAEDEMLRNGIVAVGDICNNTLTLPQKQLKRITYYNFIETSGWLPGIATQRFEKSLDYYRSYQAGTGSQQLSLSPHAPYSVSEPLWQLLVTQFPGKTITIHNQETAFEDELFQKGSGDFLRMYELMKMDTSFFTPTGKSSMQSYFSHLAAAKNVLLVHNTFTKVDDVIYAQARAAANRQELFFCLCINANLYIENSVPPVDLFLQNNCNLVIGTDSLASNHSLDLLQELKTISTYFPQVPLATLLEWATLNGAKALQLQDTFGSFTVGKKPGILLLEGQQDIKDILEIETVKRLC